MNEPQKNSEIAGNVPKANVRRTRWNFPIVWTVPMVAAVIAAYLVYGRLQQLGPKITIQFKDGSGLKTGQTPIRYRGVQIGEVTAVELSEDHEAVLVKARLQRSAASIAKEGAVFWVVRPEVGIGNITGLGTVITGPEIDVLPGTGKAQSEFVGLENAPVALEEKGLKLTITADRLGSLRPGSPVYYRGVEVGTIRQSDLSPNAATVAMQVLIKQRYAKLVRSGSKFWNVSGLDVKLGLFRGLEINMESLRSLATGGIAFATPDDLKDQPAKDGMVFRLYSKPAKEWLEWTPKIPLVPMKQSREKDLKQKPAKQPARQMETTKRPEPRRIED
jgi:paraquat-inducible protein B